MEESSSSQSAETAETETIVITPTELEKLDLKNELEKVIEEQTQNKSTSASDSTTDDEHKAEECTADEKDDNEETTEEKTDDLEKTTSESKNADESPQTVDDDTVSSLKSDDFTEEPDIDRQKIKKTYRNESRSEAIVGAGDKSSTGAKVVETDSAETSAKKDLTQEAASVDPNSLQKRMKNKLCTLLNHTPLVMQVKNVNWIAPERKSPALLNSSAKTVVQINDDDGSTSDNKEDKESKSKFTIVSDEKSNLSPSEIEDMISSGKQIKSNEKLSPVQKEIADKLKNPKTAQSTSKAAADAGVKKKECLKRIQAKMYENLKKVLQEVDSFPVKDKASLSIKPVQSSTVDETKAYKSVSAAKPPEKVKENKPCYMSTYRERKRSQDDSEDSRTGKSVSDGEVIEIDSQPGSPVNLPKTVKAKIISSPLKGVINLDEDEEVVKVPKKRGRPKRISNADRPGDNDEDYTPEKDNVRTGSPFKKAIAKRYSESEKTDSPDQQNTPRKRGRPRKYFNTPPTAANNTPKSNDSQNDDLSPPPSNNDVKSKESEPSSSKQNESPDKPEGPSRKRGRPPKNKNITPEKTESKLEDTITDPLADYPAPPESKIQSEVKTPKKRGRKSKAELEALRKKQAEQSDKVETVETDKENYTQSKISGRKRKVVNYSLLNGEDSDLDEPDVKLNRRVTIDNGTSEDEEDDKSSHDEYGSSNNKNNKRVRTDDEEDEEQVPKSKQLKKDVGTDDKDENTIVERPEDKSDQKTDVTSDNKNNNINENHKVKQGDPIESNKTDGNEDHASEDAEQSNEKEKSENADEIQCGVCDVKIQKSLWAEHKRKAHNDLAWTSDEKPLNLEDTTVVQGIFNSVLQEEGVLRCNSCEKESDSLEHFEQHKKQCNINLDLSKNVKQKRRRGKPPKDGGTADIINMLIVNINAESEGNDADPLPPLESNKLEADQIKCAVCMKVMLKSQWYVHKQSLHNNLAWRVGDTPLDLNDKELVIRILKEYSKKKPLRCETCGNTRKSVVGYLSHRSRCARSQDEIDDMKVTCNQCQRRMLPVSLPTHMVLYHTNKTETESDSKADLQNLPDDESGESTKRKAANKAAKLIQDFSHDQGTIKFVKGVRFRSKDEVITKFNEDIQKSGEAACVFQNCTYTANDAEDLFQHLEDCSEKCHNGYTCNYCLTTFKQKKIVEQHIAEVHSKSEEEDTIIHDVSTDEEQLDDDSDLDDSTDGTIYTKSQITTALRMHPTFLGPPRKKLVNSCYSNAFKWTLDYYQDNCAVENLFGDIPAKIEHWEKLNHSEVHLYIPRLKRSIDFHIKPVKSVVNPTSAEYTWKNYKLFQSTIDQKGNAIIFCGGPISSISWAPTHYNSMNADQILAVGILPDPDKKYHCIYKYRDKSLIQFWNYGPLNNKTISNYQPKLEFCIAHDRGPIWSMEWCPSGCYDNDEVNGLKKLGLLAIGGSDTDVYIYTILRPQQVSGKIFRVRPTFKLILDSSFDNDLGENSYHVTRISWSKVSGHAYLAVGFSNGAIGIYNVKNQSTLFRKIIDDVIVLKPILSFKAHTEAVTGLVLSHLKDGKRWLISGSLDRDAKLWDLNDISEPVNSNKRHIITDAVWGMHWLAAIYAFNHSSLLGSVPSGLIPARNFNSAATTFLPSNSEVTSTTWSDWGNLFIQVNGGGEVICGFPDQLLYSFENDKRKAIRRSRIIASYTGCVSKKLSANERVQREQKKLLQLKGKNSDTDRTTYWEPRTYQEVIDEYGLVFCDFDMHARVKDPAQEMDKLVQNYPYHSVPKPDMYPMQSINRVVLNPNRNSFLYYACGYQVGLVRTSLLKFLN